MELKIDYKTLKQLFLILEMSKLNCNGQALIIFENEYEKRLFFSKHGKQKCTEDNLLLKTVEEILQGFDGYRISSYQFI